MNTPRLLQLLALSAIAILSTNCNPEFLQEGFKTTSLPPGTVSIPQPDASRNEALVCIYRKGFWKSYCNQTIYLNDKKVGALLSGRWTYVLTQAGNHELKVTGPGTSLAQGVPGTSQIEYSCNFAGPYKVDRNQFSLSPGEQTFYVATYPSHWHNDIRVQNVPKSQAMSEISGMSFSTLRK